jgi:hypothetical protein
MRKWVLLLLTAVALSACSAHRDDLKSPCVGADDSPCGPKRSINGWWLKQSA